MACPYGRCRIRQTLLGQALDDYLLLGRHADTEQVTGVMVEYFSEWLLAATDLAHKSKQLVAA